MCEVHNIFGFQPEVNGGMADFMKFTRASIVHKLPDSLPLELAVLIEPLACAFHAVDRARIEAGDVVVIAGAGTLGLGMIGPALTKKPAAVITLDLDPKRHDALAVQRDIIAVQADSAGAVLRNIRRAVRICHMRRH